MINTVIFDIGNVLFTSYNTHEFFKRSKSKLTLDQFVENFHSFMMTIMKVDIRPNIFADKLKEVISSDMSIDELLVTYKHYRGCIYYEAFRALTHAKMLGYTVAVLSNIDSVLAEDLTPFFKTVEFDYKFISCWDGLQKPEKEYYQYVTQVVDCKPEEILFFDDNYKNVQAAKAYGWKVYQVSANNFDRITAKIK